MYERLHRDRPYHAGDFATWSKQRSPAFPFHHLDGVTFYLSATDDNPDDDWLSEPGLSPLPGAGLDDEGTAEDDG